MIKSGFAIAEYATEKIYTKEEKFLAEMECVVLGRARLLYLRCKYMGCQPLGMTHMLCIYCLQECYSLTNIASEESLYNSQTLCDFMSIELSHRHRASASGIGTAIKQWSQRALDAFLRRRQLIVSEETDQMPSGWHRSRSEFNRAWAPYIPT